MIRALGLITALSAALTLPASAQDTSSRYTIDVVVMQAGIEIASGRTVIVEGGQAEILLTGADGQHTFTADLQLEQRDGIDDRLILEAYLGHDGVDLASPRMIMNRGGNARMVVGSGGEQTPLIEGVEVEIKPISKPASASN